MQIFRGAEVQGQDGARRIIDGPEEEQGVPGPEPVELAAVEEDEARPWPDAGGRRARCCGGRRRRFGRQAEGPPNPADRAPADGQALELPEFLGAWQSLKSRYVVRISSHHPVAERDIQRPRRGLAPPPMDQPPHPVGPIPGLERRNCRGVMLRA